MLVHRVSVRRRHDDRGTDSPIRAQCTKQIDGIMAVIPYRSWTRADRRPDVFQRSFLSDPGLIPRVEPEGRLWNQISMLFDAADAGSASFTSWAKLFKS